MSDSPSGWSAIPPAWRIALVVEPVLIAAFPLYFVFFDHGPGDYSARFSQAVEALGIAVDLLIAAGAWQLARQMTGGAASGLRIVAIANMVEIGVGIASRIVFEYGNHHHWSMDTFRVVESVDQYAWFVTAYLPVVGLAMALWRERLALAITGLVAALLVHPPELLSKLLYGWLDLGFRSGQLLYMALGLARLAIVFVMLLFVARGTPAANRQLAIVGMRRASIALWMRVAAALLVPLLAAAAIGDPDAGRNAVETWKYFMMAVAIFNVVGLAMFVVGVLTAASAELPELGRWLLALAGAAGAWCAGVALAQLVPMYFMLYGDTSEAEATALNVAVPIVAIVAIVLLAVAVRMYAVRAGLEHLRALAAGSGAAFLLLMGATILIEAWMVPDASSSHTALALMLLAAAAGLAATLIIARMCRAAADALAGGSTLPAAKLVSG